ncbi:hypothetical protein POM88_004335 [Heracleum sosnowskyi]|uniref:Uncharacterized protein n=1 Tax=Heracleum sosnowskyi TaxID=360622 RepID=A0AAD8N7L7_9APIA|nr:hypothetical protein POM88_004335 [Heracleum sosnowskyi]
MMTMGRGLRLGIMCSNRKKKRNTNSNSNYYEDEDDESSCVLEKGKQQQVKNKSKNDDDDLLTRKRKRNNICFESKLRLSKWSTGFERFEPQVLEKGSTLNIYDLLFTKDRDFLVTYNDRGPPVQAKDLEEPGGTCSYS